VCNKSDQSGADAGFSRARMNVIAMKTVGHLSPAAFRRRMRGGGFSLVEVVIAMAIVGVSAFALLSGISSGMLTMQMARENVRATQIMVERTETLRLYSWDQLNTTNFIQTVFTESYDPVSTNGGAGPTYAGTVTIAAVPMATAYSDEMKQVTVSLNWTTSGINRSRSFTTFVARNGLQNYIY
jgi:uncharacterized protein (TIGR02598 family)